MKSETSDRSDFKRCIKFARRCEKLLTAGQFEIEGNASSDWFRVVDAGTPKML